MDVAVSMAVDGDEGHLPACQDEASLAAAVLSTTTRLATTCNHQHRIAESREDRLPIVTFPELLTKPTRQPLLITGNEPQNGQAPANLLKLSLKARLTTA